MEHYGLLRPLLLQGLLNTEVPSNCSDFKKWISSGQFVVRNIPTTKTVEIEVNNEYSFNHMIAFDSCRMAVASFETMQNIQSVTSLPKSYGWIAIKSYYAAFFSAHSIMRCFGYTCSQLEKGHVDLLNSFGNVVGLSGSMKPEAGYFSGVYDSNLRIHTLKKMKNTHQDTWRTLVECLRMLSRNVLSVTGLSSSKQKISANIDEIISRLTNQGRLSNGSYLSKFRNDVNYRHEYDSWHPYGKSSIRSSKIVSFLSTWKVKVEAPTSIWKESHEAYDFFVSCREIVNLNYVLIRLIVENSGQRKNLYKQWPNKLLNIAG